MADLRILSWPGLGPRHNAFLPLFLNGLASAGCEIVSAENLDDMAAASPVDVVLIHWPERAVHEGRGRVGGILGLWRLLRLLARRKPDTRIVWLAHNLGPHDPGRLVRSVWPLFMSRLTKLIDGVITLSPGTVAPLQRAFPAVAKRPVVGLWHPAYPNAALDLETRMRLRQGEGWASDIRVLAYCGQLRPYKGLEELIGCFRKIREPKLRLLLAGLASAEYGEHLKTIADGDARIVLRLENLSDTAFREALGTCDLIVAPLRSYLHSGSIVHALSAGRPVITPDAPFASALCRRLGSHWVRIYSGSLSSETLAAAAREVLPDHTPDLGAMNADIVGKEAKKFLAELIREGNSS